MGTAPAKGKQLASVGRKRHQALTAQGQQVSGEAEKLSWPHAKGRASNVEEDAVIQGLGAAETGLYSVRRQHSCTGDLTSDITGHHQPSPGTRPTS